MHLLRLMYRQLTEGRQHMAARIDQCEVVISVFLAITVGHIWGVHHVGWAAFSGYMVMRGHVRESALRGFLRVMGSIVGALLAVACSHIAYGNLYFYTGALFVVALLSLYFALTLSRGYVWLFTGLTFGLVLIGGLVHGEDTVKYFAYSRVLEVFIGTSCCVLVSLASTYLVKVPYLGRDYYMPKKSSGDKLMWHRYSAIHALEGAIAIALIPSVWQVFRIESLSQSSVTILLVLMVPMAETADRQAASRKIVHRFFGCLCGGTVASVFLIIGAKSLIITYLGVALGVYIGRRIENGHLKIKYLGTQFTLAMLVVLVPDTIEHISTATGWGRLSGIFVGIAILEPVRFVTLRLLHYREGKA